MFFRARDPVALKKWYEGNPVAIWQPEGRDVGKKG
jgi:hypothetical protein